MATQDIFGTLASHDAQMAQHDQQAAPMATQPSQPDIFSTLAQNQGNLQQAEQGQPPQHNWVPGREFGMKVATGMGLNAPALAKAEDTGGTGGALEELGNQVWEGLKGLVKDPLSPITGSASNFEQAIKSKDPGQILGALSTILGGAEGAEKGPALAAEKGAAARESIGKSIHTPEGELTEGANAIARAGGGAVGAAGGHAVGGPVGAAAGGAAGYTLGPSLLERMFPEPESQIAARETYKNTKEITEAQEAALKQAERMAETERIRTERAAAAEKAAREAVQKARDQHAEDLMRRQREQDKLDAAAIRAQNAAARAKREAEDAVNDKYNQKAEDLMRRQKEQDALDAAHARALKELESARQKELAQNEKFKEQHAASLNRRGNTPKEKAPAEELHGNPTPFEGNPQDLITRTKKVVRPGELPTAEDLKRAGDMTQVSLPKLKLLASWGDKLAENELNRRLRNE